MKKSVLAIALAVLMAVSLLTVGAMAGGDTIQTENSVAKYENADGDTTYFDTVGKAISAANAGGGGTITLLKDTTLTDSVVVRSGITLNLGGNTITFTKADTNYTNSYGFVFISGSNQLINGTINDERSKGNNTYGWFAVAVQAPAALTTENVTIASYVPDTGNGYNYPLRAYNTDSNGGVNLTLNSGTKIMEIEQETNVTYGTCGVTILGNNKEQNPAVLTINNGVDITSMAFAISGNGSSDGTKFIINGGNMTSTNATAFYVPQVCDLEIHGGTITGKAGGVQFCGSGSIMIDGGTLIATGPYTEFPNKPSTQGDGSADDGAALSIVSRGGGYQAAGTKIDVNITGGEFISQNNAAISVYRLQKVENGWATNNSTSVDNYLDKLNVAGGSFTGGEEKGAFEVDTKAENTVLVSNGSFSSSVPAGYLVNGLDYQLKSSNGRFSYYTTLDAAMEAAANDNGAAITGVGDAAGVETCTVKLACGNGSVDFVQTVPVGTEYPLPAAPSNSGYIFLGWRSGEATYKAGEVVTITADTTFTAVWGNLPDVKPSEPETPDTPVFPFYDVTVRDWYYSAVKYVYEKGLMDGVDVGVFAPNNTLTRAMVWTIIARAEGVDTTGGATWYAKAQEWVTAKGISDGENPSAAITRQELVTMLYRLAGEPAVSGTITAPDAASVSTWATNAMTWAMNIGLVEGDENGAVTPTATATRAQAAALIMRYLEA